ncbi:hypothetical protein ASG90_06940 [Nocardioides sp. Soil797]|nr:hypothetical protein ASG90_06940 [Nocardioides sp. Soil797]
MTSSTIRRAAASILLAVAVAAWVVGGLQRLTVGSDLNSLLPADDPAVSDIETQAEEFGGDPIVVLLESPPGDEVLGQDRLPALLELEGALSGLPDVAVTYGPATTLNQSVIRIQDMLASLSGTRDALTERGEMARLRKFEKRYGALMVSGMPAGLPTLKNESFVKTVVFDGNGNPKPQWHQYLPAAGDVAIYVRPRENLDPEAASGLEDSIRNLVDTSTLSKGDTRATVTGTPLVTSDLADEVSHEVPLLGAIAFGAVAVVLLLAPWLAGRRLRRLLPLAPMLVATLATVATFGWMDRPLSMGAATFLPVLLGLGTYYPVYLTQRGHRRLVLGVAGAASLSFLVLCASPLPFVKDLGIAIPLGIALVVALTLTGHALWGHRFEDAAPDASAAPAGSTTASPAAPVARSTSRGPGAWALVGVLGLLSLFGWTQLPHLDIRTDPQELVRGLPALDDAQHVEDELGFSAEIDVVLHGDDVLTPEALAWLRQAQQQVVLAHGDRIRPVASAADVFSFLGPNPTQSEVDAGVGLLPDYVTGAVLAPDRSTAVISLGTTWDDLAADRDLVHDLREALPPAPPGHSVDVIGIPVAAERGYGLVSQDLYLTNVAGILAAGLCLALVLRRRTDALWAMAAATIATGLGMFVASVAGLALNPLTLSLGSLSAAVGCEFTVLLMAARRTGDDRLRRSVLLAAALSAAGYLALTFSALPILREFGLSLTATVGLSLLSALAVLRLSGVRDGVGPRERPTGDLERHEIDHPELEPAGGLR